MIVLLYFQVVFRTKQKVKKKIVKDSKISGIIRSLANQNCSKKTAHAIYNSNLRDHMNNVMLAEVKKELSNIKSTVNNSILRRINGESISAFNLNKVNLEIKTWAPLVYQIMETMTKGSSVGTAVTCCVAMKFNNTHMSAFQHTVGQLLDHCGATDQV